MAISLNINTLNPSLISLPNLPHPQSSPLDRKLEGVAQRILNSPFIKAIAATALLCTATVLAVTLPLSFPLFAIAAAVAAVGLTVLIWQKKDQIWFELSLLAVHLQAIVTKHLSPLTTERHWFDPIQIPSTPASHLFLGAIPLATMQHHLTLPKLSQDSDGTAVLTVLQPFENQQAGLVGDPVRPQDWKKLNVSHKQIEIFDLQPIPEKQLEEGADFIHEQMDLQHKDVYVHCKAGRGRSAMMVLSYLMKYRKEAIEKMPGEDFVNKAIGIVQNSRPQLTLTAQQRTALRNFSQNNI